MVNTTTQKKEILDFVFNIHELAKQGKWVARYDALSDEFSLTVPRLTKDSKIKYVNQDIALYYSSKNKIEGLFIEYYKNNFINHEGKEYKGLRVVVDKAKVENQEGFVELKGIAVLRISNDLQQIVKNSIVKSLEFQI